MAATVMGIDLERHDILVGRGQELGWLAEAFQQPGLVTLLGPGGVGKTRLATAFAARQDQGTQVRIVWLDELRSADAIPGQLAQALDLPSTGDGDLSRVARALAASPSTLLVVDNAEHLVDAVREIVAQLPLKEARVLVTSRVALDIPEEQRLIIPELDLDHSAELLAIRASRFGVDLSDEACGPLLEALDGLPLAIELAAARTAILTPSQIHSRLKASNKILASRGDSRHGALDRTIAWSWDLLDEEERAVARSIALFDHPLEPGLVASLLPELDVYSIAQELEAKSWLRVVDGPQGKRWTTLRSIRRFVDAQITEEQRDAQHARLLAWAEAHIAEPIEWWRGFVPEAITVAESLEEAAPRRAAALCERIFHGAFAGPLFPRLLDLAVRVAKRFEPEVDQEQWADFATKISKGVYRYASTHSPLHWSRRAVEEAPAGTTVWFRAAAHHILCLIDAGHQEQGISLLEEVLEGRDELPQEPGVALSMIELATSAHEIGRLHLVREICGTVLTYGRTSANPFFEAQALLHLACASHDLGDFERAEQEIGRIEHVLCDSERLEVIEAIGVLGALLDLRRGRFDAARVRLDELLARARERSDVGPLFYAHLGFAELAAHLEPDAAREHLDEALVAAMTLGSPKMQAHVRFLIALDDINSGDFRSALAHLGRLQEEEVSPANASAWEQTLEAMVWFARRRRFAEAPTGQPPGPAPATLVGAMVRAVDEAIGSGDETPLEKLIAEAGPEPWNVPGLYLIRLDDIARRWVQRHRRALGAVEHRLALDREGLRFRLDDGPVHDISRRGAARLILVRLARARLEAPGEAIDVEEIIEAGWPGERILHEAARTRVYTTMNRLRALGIGDWLLTLDEGYALDPRLGVEWVEDFD